MAPASTIRTPASSSVPSALVDAVYSAMTATANCPHRPFTVQAFAHEHMAIGRQPEMAASPLAAKAWGPYACEEETLREPMPQAVRYLHDSGQTTSGDPDRLVRATVQRHLLEACADSHVELGAYDRRILAWLSDAAQVVIGLIRRAHASGIAAQGNGRRR